MRIISFALFALFGAFSFGEDETDRLKDLKYVKAAQFPWFICINYEDTPRSEAILITKRSAITYCATISEQTKDRTALHGAKSWSGYNGIGGTITCYPKIAQYYQRRSVVLWTGHPKCFRYPAYLTKDFPNIAVIYFNQDFIVTQLLRPLQKSQVFNLEWSKYEEKLRSVVNNRKKHQCLLLSLNTMGFMPEDAPLFIPGAITYNKALILSPEECYRATCRPQDVRFGCRLNNAVRGFKGFCVRDINPLNCFRYFSVFCDDSLMGFTIFELCFYSARYMNPNSSFVAGRLDNLDVGLWEQIFNNIEPW